MKYTTTSPSGETRDGMSIEFGDIKVGDRVRGTELQHGLRATYEGTVAKIGESYLIIGDVGSAFGADLQYELLERPKPEFKPGQVDCPSCGTTLTVAASG